LFCNCPGRRPQVRASSRKTFFFEKKKQKTFAQLASAFPQRLSLNVSKFFGAFFKKNRFMSFLLDKSVHARQLQAAWRILGIGGG
jgi:hypothetical protein